jgi:circadian clock protein KaiC
MGRSKAALRIFLFVSHRRVIVSANQSGNPISFDTNEAEMTKKAESTRCVTGIEGLDRIIGGGLPVGGTILVAGICGSGKSALGIEFLVRGALLGQKGVLISTVHSAEKLMTSAPHLDFYDPKLVESGMLQMIVIEEVMKFAKVEHQLIDTEGALHMVDSIKSMISTGGVKRLVIDSTTPLLMEMEPSAGREFLKGLANLLYEKKCTGILVSEISQSDGYEMIIADGIITLGNFERRGDILRVIQVVKMSGAAHSRSRYVTDSTSLGLLLTPLLRGL